MSNNDKSDKKNKKKNIFTGIINLFSNQNKKKIDDDISSNFELDNKEIESVEDSKDRLAEEIYDSENNLKTDEEKSDEIKKNSKEEAVESRKKDDKKDDIDHESFKRLELVIKETEEKKRIENENKRIKRANELRLYELKQKQILKNNENAERKQQVMH